MIGRGYSGSTLCGLILSAHAVLILSPAGFHCAEALNAKIDNPIAKRFLFMTIKIS
jgi:hypothetical protein